MSWHGPISWVSDECGQGCWTLCQVNFQFGVGLGIVAIYPVHILPSKVVGTLRQLTGQYWTLKVISSYLKNMGEPVGRSWVDGEGLVEGRVVNTVHSRNQWRSSRYQLMKNNSTLKQITPTTRNAEFDSCHEIKLKLFCSRKRFFMRLEPPHSRCHERWTSRSNKSRSANLTFWSVSSIKMWVTFVAVIMSWMKDWNSGSLHIGQGCSPQYFG